MNFLTQLIIISLYLSIFFYYLITQIIVASIVEVDFYFCEHAVVLDLTFSHNWAIAGNKHEFCLS